MLNVIFYSLIGGIVSLIGGILLLSNKKSADSLAKYATPFAGGALLGAVFLDLLKDGLEESSPESVLYGSLAGILIFFIAEGFLHWFHHHHNEGDKVDSTLPLIIAGDTIHNLMDGVAIAAALLVSVPAGVITTIAVAAHEIPQEIGDFGLMLAKGMKRGKVLLVNVLSALATTFAAIITYLLGSHERIPVGVLLGLSAGFLLYIAVSDVIPTIHDSSSSGNHKKFAKEAGLLIFGVIVVGVAINLAHRIAG